MKKLFFLLVLLASCFIVLAQQDNRIIINPAKQNQEEVIKKMYQYSQFEYGKALAKDGEVAQAKFNYSYLTNRMYFINAKGDTLELSNGENFNNLVINNDTFHYYNKEFIQQVTHNLSLNLYIKRTLRNVGSEKKGAYDTYSSTSSTSSIKSVVDNRVGTINLTVDENIIFELKDEYYLSGKFGQFYPATKKGVYDLLPKNHKEIKQFLETNDINFNKIEDLKKLLDHINTSLIR